MTINDRNVSISVGTDNVVISEDKSQNNVKRIFYSIINTSTGGQIISISFTDEAGAGKGIPLSPGGQISESEDNGFQVTKSRISAVSSIAGGTIAVAERVRVN